MKDQDESDQSYDRGDYRSSRPVTIKEQREFVEQAKENEIKRKKQIEDFWETEEPTVESLTMNIPINISTKKAKSKKKDAKNEEFTTFFD